MTDPRCRWLRPLSPKLSSVLLLLIMVGLGTPACSGCSDTTGGDSASTPGEGEGGADAGDSDQDGATVDRPPLGEPTADSRCVDADGDGYYAGCPAGDDCHDGDASVHPGADEVCDDNIDNDCASGPDNGCGCETDGETRPCYPGAAGTLQGACRAGTQTCEGGTWSSCTGQILPVGELCDGEDEDCDGDIDEGLTNGCGTCGEPGPDLEEICDDGIDNDCDGAVDEACTCTSRTGDCYVGPPQTRGVGACADGTRACDGEFWGNCVDSVGPVGEVCGDGIDNDCDGETDEGCQCTARPEICDGIDNDCNGVVDDGCTPCLDLTGGSTPWQMHEGQGPGCWDQIFDGNGDPGEYDFAEIPAAGDGGWIPEADDFISFDDPSTMCGQEGEADLCPCRGGGDFTYFQTFFQIPEGLDVDSLTISIDNVDDGARITIFNSAHPDGIVDQGSYAFLGGGSTTDLAQYIVVGNNRIVITHVDDCCRIRRIAGVHVTLNGEEVVRCGMES